MNTYTTFVANGGVECKERLAKIAFQLARGEEISAPKIERLYLVSRATAKRDLNVLEHALPVQRTRGVLRALNLNDRSTTNTQ